MSCLRTCLHREWNVWSNNTIKCIVYQLFGNANFFYLRKTAGSLIHDNLSCFQFALIPCWTPPISEVHSCFYLFQLLLQSKGKFPRGEEVAVFMQPLIQASSCLADLDTAGWQGNWYTTKTPHFVNTLACFFPQALLKSNFLHMCELAESGELAGCRQHKPDAIPCGHTPAGCCRRNETRQAWLHWMQARKNYFIFIFILILTTACVLGACSLASFNNFWRATSCFRTSEQRCSV